jgi:LmbE family N-acetylglucosaminyl deacetylase
MSAAPRRAGALGASPPAERRLLDLSATDRLLVLSPHPDDESLATGGLLQAALAVGADTRVLYATDGDLNPWAQLVVEGRWPATAAARARWGALRRREATRALRALGLPEERTTWLGLPDQHLTALLLAGDERLLAALLSEVRLRRPTLIVAPSTYDRHPDHSAVSVTLALALARLGAADARVLEYRVHTGRRDPEPAWWLPLGPAQRERKRQAILCHESQLRWHHRTLLACAREHEGFEPALVPPDPRERHPILDVALEDRMLHVGFVRARRPGLGPLVMRVVVEGDQGPSLRASVVLPARPGPVPVRDAASRRNLAPADLRRTSAGWRLDLPLEGQLRPRLGFVKLERPREQALGFFDAAGWRPVAAPEAPHDPRPGTGRAPAAEAAGPAAEAAEAVPAEE